VRNALFSALAVVAAVILVAVVGGSQPGKTVHAKISIKVIQMFRSVTVSPTSVACGNYEGGNPNNLSTSAALGFPHAKCSVGTLHSKVLPLTVSYNGPLGQVQIESSDAVPDGGGTTWRLCGPGTSTGCKGQDGRPGIDQFRLQNFATVPGREYLSSNFQCDTVFNPGGACTATRGMSQQEGFWFFGPKWTFNHATSYTVTITWLAAPPPKT
jgi:hypothetical protein